MTDPTTAEDRPRNQHCMNCGDTRGGPIGHETSECTYDSRMAELRTVLKPGFMLTLSRLVHDAQQDTHPLADAAGSTGPYVVQGCVVYGAQQLKDAIKTVWKTVPALLSELEAAQARLDKARSLHYLSEELSCGNWEHTNRDPGVICPECVAVCEHCCEPWPCPDAVALGLGEEGTDNGR